MATYDLTVGSGFPYQGRRSFELEAVFDATVQNLVQNDVAKIIVVPANTVIQTVFWRVATVEGASRNFAIGDSSATNTWITTTTANSLAAGITATGTLDSKLYTAADYLSVLAVTSGGLTGCKLYVKALCWRVDDPTSLNVSL